MATAVHPFLEQRTRCAAEHFRLLYFATVLDVIEKASHTLGSLEAMDERFPFLSRYLEQVPPELLTGGSPADRWRSEASEWAASAEEKLPVARLIAAGVPDFALRVLFWSGLVEEDARFASMFAAFQEGAARPTLSLLQAWLGDSGLDVRLAVQQLSQRGMINVFDAAGPRSQWTLAAAPLLWDVLRGGDGGCEPSANQPALDSLVLDTPISDASIEAAEFLREQPGAALVLRGPAHSGRGTLARALARNAGYKALALSGENPPDPERLNTLCCVATAQRAMLILRSSGDLISLPEWYQQPTAILTREGGPPVGDSRPVFTLDVRVPDPETRRRLWIDAGASADHATKLAERFRIGSGRIHQLARCTRPGSESSCAARLASEARHAFEGLASQVSTSSDWSLFSGPETLTVQLRDLQLRCRLRERLPQASGPILKEQLGCGVVALLKGPSGTGKTYAARLLAGSLGRPLFRADLASVVSKYIGETEKNLQRLLTLAEELDCVLVLDEGDALLAQRTMVATANDRYANLETDFLLQRLETFEGILLITTNAGDRIDSAFQRRLDVVIDFPPPAAAERLIIWRMHLPEGHALEERDLMTVAGRCDLSGGQIRNAVLHACLLALSESGPVSPAHVHAGVLREYRKFGQACPLGE